MVRRVIQIDEDKCNGCGLCAQACHEGAIGMVGGKAKLLRDDYCDGLGDCLPACPTGAITFVEREAAAFSLPGQTYEDVKAGEALGEHNKTLPSLEPAELPQPPASGCPGSQARQLKPLAGGCPGSNAHSLRREPAAETSQPAGGQSQLAQWPVQIKLVPVQAPYFDGARLLVAADCAAYACGSFHDRFMKDRITLIGCPKLDEGDYTEKLTEILRRNDIKSVTVARMEVPCCGGLEQAVKNALQSCGKMIPWQVVTITTDGQIIKS